MQTTGFNPTLTLNSGSPPLHTLHTNSVQHQLQYSDSLILNLSKSFHPSPSQLSLLQKGLSFIPRPSSFNQELLQRDILLYHRRLKLVDYYHDRKSREQIPFTLPSTWEPHHSLIHPILQLHIRRDLNSFLLAPRFLTNHNTSNLSPQEHQAIKQLKSNKHILIKPANKGAKIVILDTHQYLHEANRQLSNTLHYKPIPSTIQPLASSQLRKLLEQLYSGHYISRKQYSYLLGPDPPRSCYFYLLPKIHKPPETWTIPFEVPPGCPIVSDCNSCSYNISNYLDHFINPLSTLHPSYIKDMTF